MTLKICKLKPFIVVFCTCISFICFSQVKVKIVPLFNGKPIALDQSNTGKDSTLYTFSTLRFYLSNLRMMTLVGERELKKIHLFDLEDTSSYELFRTTEALSSLDFLLGTDSSTNVSGILDGPLDPIHGMYWTWNSGYINFKLEGTRTSLGKTTNFEYHLGGYLAPFSTARSVHLENAINAKGIRIELYLDQWINGFQTSVSNLIMIPGKEAAVLMDQLVPVFKIGHEE